MKLLLVLLIVLAIGILVLKLYNDWPHNEDNPFIILPTWTVVLCVPLFLILHLVSWGTASTKYEMYVVRRDAFIQTLENARVNGNPQEINAIAKDIATWNIELAQYKFDNKRILYDTSIDDRFEQLHPIK